MRLEMKYKLQGFLICSALGLAAAGCGSDGEPQHAPQAPPDAVPASVPVSASKVTLGKLRGVLRAEVDVGSFRITKHPVTVSDYRRCVDAGTCRPPTYDCEFWPKATGGELDAAPMMCATVDQAANYCRWVGGALPRVEQWELAARGPNPTQYAWGNDAISCDRYRTTLPLVSGEIDCCGSNCLAPASLAVGRHTAGRSPSAVEDIMSPLDGELVAHDAKSLVAACRGTAAACIVRSLPGDPGSIGSVIGVPKDVTKPGIARNFGFRCAWSAT
jgi:hypothetical protein